MPLKEVNVTEEGVSHNSSSDQTSAIRTALGKAGDAANGYSKTVYFPAGTYYVSNWLLQLVRTNSQITIRGDGPGATTIKLHSTTANYPTIFQVQGDAPDANNPLGIQAPWFTFRDMTLHGDGRAARWFYFERASLVRMDHVEIFNTVGTGVYGNQWWDSCLHDVHFGKVGDISNQRPAMVLQSLGASPTKDTSCNNLKFEACRWESHPYVACRLRDLTRIVSFLGCKWHGPLPRNEGVLFPQIDIMEDAYGISFTGCRLANWGNTHLKATSASGIMMTGSMIGGADNYGIDLQSCSHCSITTNNFAADAGAGESGNTNGNINVSGGTNILLDNNNG